MGTPANTTVANDVVPGITIDYVSRMKANLDNLMQVLGISEPQPVAEGNQVKIYAISQENTPDQPAEGEEIARTEIKRTVAKTIDMTLMKYRKTTTAEAIQKSGRNVAIDKTDEKFISGIQKGIKASFFTSVKDGTGTATSAATLQAQMANNWAALQAYYEDEECHPVHFVNPLTAAGYLAANNLTVATEFGMNYVKTLLGTLIITTEVSANDVWSTAEENLGCAYVPVDGSEIGDMFGLIPDESGYIGMVHVPEAKSASVDTIAMTCVEFFPEVLAGVFKGTVDPS